jgi:hypothetical protein
LAIEVGVELALERIQEVVPGGAGCHRAHDARGERRRLTIEPGVRGRRQDLHGLDHCLDLCVINAHAGNGSDNVRPSR